jgi:hypothetical protein
MYRDSIFSIPYNTVDFIVFMEQYMTHQENLVLFGAKSCSCVQQFRDELQFIIK